VDACCSPSRGAAPATLDIAAPGDLHGGDVARHREVALPGGSFAMGDEGPAARPEDGEGPIRGSHLCHDCWCNRCRVSARTGTAPDSATSHVGFRTVAA